MVTGDVALRLIGMATIDANTAGSGEQSQGPISLSELRRTRAKGERERKFVMVSLWGATEMEPATTTPLLSRIARPLSLGP